MEKTVEVLDTFGDDRFFLYVHVLDPHDPYVPPEENKIFGEPYEGKDFIAEGRTFPVKQLLNGARDDFTLEPADIQHFIDLYDAEILAVDGHLRQLFAQFEARGLLEDTLFVFVSDHGESFLEHEGVFQHGTSLYQSEIHTLFLLYRKGHWSGGERRGELACTIDVMPTVLEIAGLPTPEGTEGMSLLNLDRAGRRGKLCHSAGRADWRAQQANLLALRAGSEKLIFDRGADHYELYDLSRDADETNNLASSDNPRLAPLRTVLETWDQSLDGQEGSVELDPEAEKALRALGYID
jgi:arylsulfatase A-like enzyme